MCLIARGDPPAGIKGFGRSKGGHLYDDPARGRIGTVQAVETSLMEGVAIEQGMARCQNLGLMAQALGLGDCLTLHGMNMAGSRPWIPDGGDARHTLPGHGMVPLNSGTPVEARPARPPPAWPGTRRYRPEDHLCSPYYPPWKPLCTPFLKPSSDRREFSGEGPASAAGRIRKAPQPQSLLQVERPVRCDHCYSGLYLPALRPLSGVPTRHSGR